MLIYESEELQTGDGSKGIFSNVKERVRRIAPLNLDQFSDHLRAMWSKMGEVLDRINPATGAYDLESFELGIDVTATGEVRLVGSVGTELKGGIKLVFRRQLNKKS